MCCCAAGRLRRRRRSALHASARLRESSVRAAKHLAARTRRWRWADMPRPETPLPSLCSLSPRPRNTPKPAGLPATCTNAHCFMRTRLTGLTPHTLDLDSQARTQQQRPNRRTCSGCPLSRCPAIMVLKVMALGRHGPPGRSSEWNSDCADGHSPWGEGGKEDDEGQERHCIRLVVCA